jgi:hypothetical protein
MAKKRKAARKAKAKKTTRVKVRRAAKRPAKKSTRRAKRTKSGGMYGAISEAAALRRRLAGHDTFED